MPDLHKKRSVHVNANYNGSPVERGEFYRQNLTASHKHHDFSGANGEHDFYETPDVASEHNPPKKWAQAAVKQMKKKGTEGSLTRAAHAAGYDSALAYAHHIKANKEDYSGKMRKKANFAANMNE